MRKKSPGQLMLRDTPRRKNYKYESMSSCYFFFIQQASSNTSSTKLIFYIFIMQFFMKCLALLPLFTMAVSGASKFADTCQNIEGRGTQIRADCRENEHGQYRTSTLDLNRCIKNNKGGLKCGKKSVKSSILGDAQD